MSENIEEFEVRRSNFPDAANWLEERLKENRLKDSEIYIAHFLAEEIFLLFEQHEENPSGFTAKIKVIKQFGRSRVLITAKGEEYNPLIGWENENQDVSVDYAILNAYAKKLKYSRNHAERGNVVTITPGEIPLTEVKNIFAGVIAGAVIGISLNALVEKKTAETIANTFLDPVQALFIHILMMALAPTIFFTVVSGIFNMSKSINVGSLGLRLMTLSMVKLAFFVAAGLGMGYAVGAVPELLSVTTDGNNASPNGGGISFIKFVENIVPNDMISPFEQNNIIQTLFMACFFGVLLNKLEGQLEWAKEGLDFFTRLSMKALGVVTIALPGLVAVSTAEMVMRLGLYGLIYYGKLLIFVALGLPITFIVTAVLIAVLLRISPFPFLKKSALFASIPFSVCNSGACLPATINFCSDKLGINKRITNFALPVGMQFNMDGTAYYVSVVSMMLVLTFGVEINADFLISLFFVEFMMALTGVGLLTMPSVLESMGIPGSAVMHFIGVEPIMDMSGTAQNVVGNVASAFIAAKCEGEVDEAIYKNV